jgi:chorismate mutase/prephenate dehydrogenase
LPALQRLARQGLRVTSIHPMFGPDTELLSGRHVLFLEVGVPAATRQAIELFEPTMARQIEMPLEDHDRLIAFVLGLSHALNIAFFTVAAKVAGENPQLYFEIQHDNPHGEDALHALAAAVDRLRRIVSAGDRGAFVALMESGREYLARRR